MARQDDFEVAAAVGEGRASRCERGFARLKVYWISGLDLARDPGANQCAREVSHGFFHPSDEFHQRHEGGAHQGPSTIRADDHSTGFSTCAIFLRDGYL